MSLEKTKPFSLAPDDKECDLPCMNGGDCRVGIGNFDHFKNIHIDASGNMHYCTCPLNFIGDLCEIETSECIKNDHDVPDDVCQNGAKCITYKDYTQNHTYHHCNCSSIVMPDSTTPGAAAARKENYYYAGSRCQYKSTSSPMLHCTYYGDDISDEGKDYAASTASMTSGSKDYHHPSKLPFERHFCLNNGTCPSRSFLPCACPEGYTGPHCEFTVEEMQHYVTTNNNDNDNDNKKGDDSICLMGCQNGGICLRLVLNNIAREQCVCPKGYIGLECEYQYITCADTASGGRHSMPCFHGSTCVVAKTEIGGKASFSNKELSCDCENANVLAAGGNCQYIATDVCYGNIVTVPQNDSTYITNNINNNSIKKKHRGICVNNGKCVIDSSGFSSCQCINSFYGPHCEFYKIAISPGPDFSSEKISNNYADSKSISNTSSSRNSQGKNAIDIIISLLPSFGFFFLAVAVLICCRKNKKFRLKRKRNDTTVALQGSEQIRNRRYKNDEDGETNLAPVASSLTDIPEEGRSLYDYIIDHIDDAGLISEFTKIRNAWYPQGVKRLSPQVSFNHDGDDELPSTSEKDNRPTLNEYYEDACFGLSGTSMKEVRNDMRMEQYQHEQEDNYDELFALYNDELIGSGTIQRSNKKKNMSSSLT